MAHHPPKDLVYYINSSTEAKVIYGLREIKRRVVPDINVLTQFRAYGFVPILLKLLQWSNEEIVNYSLSILSVCTSDARCREEVFSLNGHITFVNIYKNVETDILRLRTCRNIANQSQHVESCSAFHQEDIVQTILTHLKLTQDEEFIKTAVRAIRILSDTGDHCQAVVQASGVTVVCEKGLYGDPSVSVLKATLKTLAQFSRISHSACISQIMSSTDNLMLVTRYHDSGDMEVYELILRTILNIVRSCFNSSHKRSKSLDAKVIDHLCTAKAPSIIVCELKSRKVPNKNISEEFLIMSLCKFCQGSSQCHNLAQHSFYEPPTFLGRAWMQLMECSGVSLLVNLLEKHTSNMKLLSSIYGALLGIENNYSFKEKVLKHCLAANIIPILVKQFDDAIKEYKSIRRESDPNHCVHQLKSDTKEENERNSQDLCLETNITGSVTPTMPTSIKTPVPIQEAVNNPFFSPNFPSTSSHSTLPDKSYSPPPMTVSSPTMPVFPIMQADPGSPQVYHRISPAPSPPPSLSPIRCPSDWDEDDEDDEEVDRCESSLSGRFSPTVPEQQDLTDPSMETEEIDSSDVGVNQSILDDIDEKLMISSELTPKKRSNKELIIDDLDKKRIKTDKIESVHKDSSKEKPVIIEKFDEPDKETGMDITDNKDKEYTARENKNKLSGIKEMSQIKFRVGKKQGSKRKVTLLKPQPTANLDDLWVASETAKSLQPSSPLSPKSPQSPTFVGKTKKEPRIKIKSDANSQESTCLALLEWIIRMMCQVSIVKEAISPVCRVFVPRVIKYISCAQKLHCSALNILVFIAKNTLSIQPLLDAQFIPYVAVELIQSRAPSIAGHCRYCVMLHDGGKNFLAEMNKFFNHVHQYGRQEVSSRLHPDRNRATKESCAFAIPHIMTCPKILHNFLVRYPGLDILLEILTSDALPDSASFIYAAAALSQLAITLQVDFQLKKFSCPLCAQSIKNAASDLDTTKSSTARLPTPDCNGHPVICHWIDDKNKNLTFKLEDGSEMCANRELLASRNDILRGMLKGAFAESVKEQVELTGISKKCLEFLIHFLYGCTCRVYYDGNLELYLELVFAAQMYFLSSLGNFAAFKVVSNIEKPEDVLRIYESGVGRIHEDAILHALCIVLVKPMKTWKRARWFKCLFTSKFSEDIIHNITMILKHPLDVNNEVCNCDMSHSLYKVSEKVYEKL